MPRTQASPAWVSTAVGPLFAGPRRDAAVLAATRAACYVAVPAGDAAPVLFALLAPGAVRLPIGVSLTDVDLPAQGDPVRIGAGVVSWGRRSWRPARWWDPRPRLRHDALIAHARLLADVVGAEPRAAFGLPPSDAAAVAAALARGEAGPALDVLGRGPGLTPAGDDVIAGAMALLAGVGRLRDPVRDVLVERARTRTTALSSALVAAAGRGEMIPQAARLLSSVATGGPPQRIAAAADDLFAVGSTSGHDLAAGMAGALVTLAVRASSTGSTSGYVRALQGSRA